MVLAAVLPKEGGGYEPCSPHLRGVSADREGIIRGSLAVLCVLAPNLTKAPDVLVGVACVRRQPRRPWHGRFPHSLIVACTSTE